MDIDAIKSRLNQLQNTTSNNFWKPQPGKSQVRIVPYTHDKNNPFSELFFHYSLVPNKTVLSPLSFGRPDPVQQFADKLKSSGNKDEWIQGKRIEPKMRTFVPVIARGEENDGVKFWGFGKTVYQELLGIIADPDTVILVMLQLVVILSLNDKHPLKLVISTVRQLFELNQIRQLLRMILNFWKSF